MLFKKAPRHNRFDFQPRYYDPEKEKREARLDDSKSRIRFEKGNLYRNASSPIVGAFTDRHDGNNYRERARDGKKQVIRIVIIAGVLLLLFAMSLSKMEGFLEAIF